MIMLVYKKIALLLCTRKTRFTSDVRPTLTALQPVEWDHTSFPQQSEVTYDRFQKKKQEMDESDLSVCGSSGYAYSGFMEC